MASFPVDDVDPAVEMLPVLPLGALFADALTIGGDAALPVLSPDGVHPLLSAVGTAFAEHRPLVLSPDAVWLTIAEGIAQHVRLHADELRPRLVPHLGRRRLGVIHAGPMPADAESWRDVVESFGRRLAEEIVDGALFACDFSTSTGVERVAGQVVLLDAYSPYFSLWLKCVCGIPSITLTGTVADWRRIRERVDALPVFGLERWRRSLAPIADQFVHAAAGEVDTAFWQRIYNPRDAYGGDVITGWAARLYPYLAGDGVIGIPNPLLDLPIGHPRDVASGPMGYTGPGVRSDTVPATLSRLIINVNDRVDGDNRMMAVHAGLVAVAQNHDGALQPIAGWHVTPAEPRIDDVIDRIIRDHHVTAPREDRMFFASGDLAALYRRIGSATLFEGAWRIRPIDEHGRLYGAIGHPPIIIVIDLPDGRTIGAAVDDATRALHWFAGRVEHVTGNDACRQQSVLLDHPAYVPVYGTSITMLLSAALDTGGDIDHLETGRLDQLGNDGQRDAEDTPSPSPATGQPATVPQTGRRPQPPPSPDADIDEQIRWIRRAKEAAIGEQDFEQAALLRSREEALSVKGRQGLPPALPSR